MFGKDTGLKTLLTDKGTKFANHFVSLSLCCPSRVTTLKGQFAHNTGIFTNDAASGGGFQTVYNKGLEKSTIATWLHDAGYRTALFGKFLNGYPNGGSPYSSITIPSTKTVNFIKNTTTNYPNKPFFVYVAPTAPHGPATPPPRYENYYPNAQAPRTASWRKALLLEHAGPSSVTQASTDPLLEPQDPLDVQLQSTGASPVFAGLRTKNQVIGTNGPLNYIEYDTGERELYDISIDPDQLKNAYSSADATLKTKLSTWLGSLRNAGGQALRDAEEAAP